MPCTYSCTLSPPQNRPYNFNSLTYCLTILTIPTPQYTQTYLHSPPSTIHIHHLTLPYKSFLTISVRLKCCSFRILNTTSSSLSTLPHLLRTYLQSNNLLLLNHVCKNLLLHMLFILLFTAGLWLSFFLSQSLIFSPKTYSITTTNAHLSINIPHDIYIFFFFSH